MGSLNLFEFPSRGAESPFLSPDMKLGMQMKKDMLDEEDEKSSQQQGKQFSLLDEQLRQAEEMRTERRRKHSQHVDRIRQDKLLRAMNIQNSSFANRFVDSEHDYAFKEQ